MNFSSTTKVFRCFGEQFSAKFKDEETKSGKHSKQKIEWDDLEAIAYGLAYSQSLELTFHEFFLLQRGRNEQFNATKV